MLSGSCPGGRRNSERRPRGTVTWGRPQTSGLRLQGGAHFGRQCAMGKISRWQAFFSGIGRGERAVLNEAADDIASLQSWIASMSGRTDEPAKAIAQLQSDLGAVMDVLIESGGGAVDGDMLRHRVEEAIDAFQSRPAQRPTGEGGPYR